MILENTDINTDNDAVPPAKKHKALKTPKDLTRPPHFKYPVFRYPPDWVPNRDKRASSNPGEEIGSQGVCGLVISAESG